MWSLKDLQTRWNLSQVMQMIDVYTKFAYEEAAIPVIPGRKSTVTYTIEALMGDRPQLQLMNVGGLNYHEVNGGNVQVPESIGPVSASKAKGQLKTLSRVVNQLRQLRLVVLEIQGQRRKP
ncbi:hypothetical protein CTI12_AA486590 [Artemisia annua]|uniref:Uncharacterized protein n=1 Tax=Artemisia annua TaxID=35608 RepID=A0A2U1LIV2_ARTAN|nr:hypothetical protein CTI12_AA486590 [Artemisia annua]